MHLLYCIYMILIFYSVQRGLITIYENCSETRPHRFDKRNLHWSPYATLGPDQSLAA